MPVRHAEFSDLVERLAAGERLSESDCALLEEYAAPAADAVERDRLQGSTVEMVAALTGRPDASSPRRAARALLVTLNMGMTRRLGPIASAQVSLSS